MNAIGKASLNGRDGNPPPDRTKDAPAVARASFFALANRVKGCWRGEDGLLRQRRLRDEWTAS